MPAMGSLYKSVKLHPVRAGHTRDYVGVQIQFRSCIYPIVGAGGTRECGLAGSAD